MHWQSMRMDGACCRRRGRSKRPWVVPNFPLMFPNPVLGLCGMAASGGNRLGVSLPNLDLRNGRRHTSDSVAGCEVMMSIFLVNTVPSPRPATILM